MDNQKFKILSIGTDASTLDKDSRIARRVIDYGDLVDKYTIITPAEKEAKVDLSEKVTVFGVVGKNKIFKLFKVYVKAGKILQNEKYNIITVQDQYYLGFVAWLLSKKFKIGLEIQNHGFEKFSGIRKLIAKFIFPRASAVRTVSKRLKNRLIQEFGVKEEKITIVPVFFKPEEFLDTRCPIGHQVSKNSSDKFVFLTVGRLVPVKNIAMQIGAMAEILKARKDVELWIVGEGGLENNLKNLAKELNIEINIKFLGWQNDIASIYKRADVFLLTSHSEGWPVSIMEAAGYGLPVIMTDVGSAGELIINGKNGMVVPVNDGEALEAAMKKLMDDEGMRMYLGKNARKSVLGMPTKEETLRMHKKSFAKARI
ncbi:hypothetical protein A2331_03025 [Candidatus Falkowbacteria bacterium RIFOXYB2_FULL_34_18]|uniref:Glycosyl transferase family 1 domain-containing protein n=1 Tax=Candidatus Falkowbacteria bacterium RIFOXYD2_FULL_34_120 TaxID=1798007 RepID=A0A1F5TMW4_9BACT|nr:MAG: hypothetical protein A2331_03025 [Candidatus Falkowbacteria bacterium RIFOXYB2_FULL_34_18]OGF28319.1 MAG: hypothetical protein A2500_02915 [Candidatus Falkowbacteria bacterium RIFOXYC12_FULL_34_55]OGF37962.1 MAG: hypothetical protein A2466_06170 [Candidatus Falkowbacteria bacterium RIFOXYC2_FULL_34_220]OGF39680.1 MAG: hypothetical protein A2515_07465 [Candidatus Falkowbacteria bacterium RIFOXYD12_FULL_34_57]OGF40119.1 MAG: hypothetical protein A2531_05160 [Candidatus Falkowbacteria bact